MLQGGDKYFCDSCFNKKLSIDRCTKKPIRTKHYISTKLIGDYERHLNSSKHIKNTEELTEEQKQSLNYCKYCDSYMDDDGYKIHKERNKKMWKFKYGMKLDITEDCMCNNFIYNNRRFGSWEQLSLYSQSNPMFIENKVNNVYTKEKELVNPTEETEDDIDASSSEDDYDYEPYDYCYEPECLLPMYKDLSRERKKMMELNGVKWCKCRHVDSSSEEEEEEIVIVDADITIEKQADGSIKYI